MAASSHAQHMLDNLDREQLIEKVCDALQMQNQLIAGSGAPLPASLQTLQTLDVEMSCSERRARQLLVEKSLSDCVPRWGICNAPRITRSAWRQDEAARLDISTVDEVDLAALRDEVPHLIRLAWFDIRTLRVVPWRRSIGRKRLSSKRRTSCTSKTWRSRCLRSVVHGMAVSSHLKA